MQSLVIVWTCISFAIHSSILWTYTSFAFTSHLSKHTAVLRSFLHFLNMRQFYFRYSLVRTYTSLHSLLIPSILQIWDIPSWFSLFSRSGTFPTNSLYSPDLGHSLVIPSILQIWDIPSWFPLFSRSGTFPCDSLYSPDLGHSLVIPSILQIWDIPSWFPLFFRSGTFPCDSLYSPDLGHSLLIPSILQIWDIPSWFPLFSRSGTFPHDSLYSSDLGHEATWPCREAGDGSQWAGVCHQLAPRGPQLAGDGWTWQDDQGKVVLTSCYF